MQRPEQQIVILSQVLVDDVNTGFQGFQNLQVGRGAGGVAPLLAAVHIE